MNQMTRAFKYEQDSAGIVTITMDMSGPVNTLNGEYRQAMGAAVKQLGQEAGLKGVILASAKSTFFAGGDLKYLLALRPGDESEFFAFCEATKRDFRRLEKLPVPVVAAINGAALGGGYELALACNYRIVLNAAGTVVGQPEVSLGLLPGGGGIVRLVHMLGLEKALPFLLEGTRVKPSDALKAGLVDAIVDNPTHSFRPQRRGFWRTPKLVCGPGIARTIRFQAAPRQTRRLHSWPASQQQP